MKILIWGCGERSKTFLEEGYIAIQDIYAFIDSYLQESTWYGKKVLRPAEVRTVFYGEDIDYIIVTTKNYEVCREIHGMLADIGIAEEKLLFVYNRQKEVKRLEVHTQNSAIFQDIAPKLYKKEIEKKEGLLDREIEITRCGFDSIDDNIFIGTEGFRDKFPYMNEYVRFRTFELVANEIQNKKMKGAVAEIGVFRGAFAQLINAKFPDRKLYLYDSFESFREEEFEIEVRNNNCQEDFLDVFKQTSVEVVMDGMKHPENCVLRKGYFPESMREEDRKEKFVFVSMDVDFEESTYQCLRHMYPLVVEGGYIFLHDYNNRFLNGVKKAVQRYEKEMQLSLKKIPICDEGGTVIIIK